LPIINISDKKFSIMSWNFRDVTLRRLVVNDVAAQPNSPIFKVQVVQG